MNQHKKLTQAIQKARDHGECEKALSSFGRLQEGA